MMITGTNPCYPNGPQNLPIYGVSQEVIHPNTSSSSTNPTSFLYNLSLLKDKVHQVQSLASIFTDSTAIATPMMGTLIQEIIVTASSMMFACQQMSLSSSSPTAAASVERGPPPARFVAHHHDTVNQWYGESFNNCINSSDDHNNSAAAVAIGNSNSIIEDDELPPKTESNGGGVTAAAAKNYDIIELEAADLLAKYTHYCQVCGKGFKRDANLRMHMRAHGDEYKSSAALSNPAKGGGGGGGEATRKYSCPQEGCRWNKKHARFQPLKSMICVKNHYKRSHCPKMYMCKRCNRKQFSVLSDLRTHEKHCGDLKWLCTCGTTFSRKDKLMGHVTLFVGHAPAPPALNPLSKNVIGNGGAMR